MSNENSMHLEGNAESLELDKKLQELLGEHAYLLEPTNGEPNREAARFWTNLLFGEYRNLEEVNRPTSLIREGDKAEDIVARMQETGIAQTSYDQHPEMEELPLHHPLIVLAEYATSERSKAGPRDEIRRAAQLLLNSLEERIVPKKMSFLSSLTRFITSSSDKDAMVAELAEAKMLTKIVENATKS